MEFPIDLLADRVMGTVEVNMNGRYPDKAKMNAALLKAKDSVNEDLISVFGNKNALN